MIIFMDDEIHQCGRVNFVDENNVFVGYEMNEICCEDFGWFIDNKKTYLIPEKKEWDIRKDVDGYIFDTSFFEREEDIKRTGSTIIIFRLINGNEEKFLHLFNVQNGYYDHGFEFGVAGEKPLKKDAI
jgi:hypothetical protein